MTDTADRNDSAPATNPPTPRKPYAPPHLCVYGGLADLTRQVTNSGMLDGSMVQTMMFS